VELIQTHCKLIEEAEKAFNKDTYHDDLWVDLE
jgi:hypothetical protein